MANKLPKNLIGAFHDDPLREDESPLSPSGFNENMPEMDGSLVQGGRLLSNVDDGGNENGGWWRLEVGGGGRFELAGS